GGLDGLIGIVLRTALRGTVPKGGPFRCMPRGRPIVGAQCPEGDDNLAHLESRRVPTDNLPMQAWELRVGLLITFGVVAMVAAMLRVVTPVATPPGDPVAQLNAQWTMRAALTVF